MAERLDVLPLPPNDNAMLAVLPCTRKIVILGASKSGKTRVYNRLMIAEGRPDLVNAEAPIHGVEFVTLSVAHGGKHVCRCQIWDTSDSPNNHEAWLRFTNVAVVCCDVTSGRSFERARDYVGSVHRVVPQCDILLCETAPNPERERVVPHTLLLQFCADERLNCVGFGVNADVFRRMLWSALTRTMARNQP